jgi:hypothetical protein
MNRHKLMRLTRRAVDAMIGLIRPHQYVTRTGLNASVHVDSNPRNRGLLRCGAAYDPTSARLHRTVPAGVPLCPACAAAHLAGQAHAAQQALLLAEQSGLSPVVLEIWRASRQPTPEHVMRQDAGHAVPMLRRRIGRLDAAVVYLADHAAWCDNIAYTSGDPAKVRAAELAARVARQERDEIAQVLTAERRLLKAYLPYAGQRTRRAAAR